MRHFGSADVDRLERLDARAFDGQRLLRPGCWAVAFMAEWCPFCREFAPRFGSLADTGASLAVADLTSYASPLWDDFSIAIVPSVVVFRGGETVLRAEGRPMEGLDDADLARIREAITSD